MNLKMKFVGATLTLSSFFAGAQSVDFEKERRDNPVAGSALACIAIGTAINVDLGKSHPQYDLIRGMLHTATKTMFSVIDSSDPLHEKMIPAVMQTLSDLQRDKIKNDSAYQKRKSQYFQALGNCIKAYP